MVFKILYKYIMKLTEEQRKELIKQFNLLKIDLKLLQCSLKSISNNLKSLSKRPI